LVKITYIEASGEKHVVEVPAGWSIMEASVKNALPGILGECGGACACGTCRVFVDERWRGKLHKPSDLEDAMLDPEDQRLGQRLGCQIKLQEELDGLVVTLPQKQY
jgi:ferredoxin, 2Fe-2S